MIEIGAGMQIKEPHVLVLEHSPSLDSITGKSLSFDSIDLTDPKIQAQASVIKQKQQSFDFDIVVPNIQAQVPVPVRRYPPASGSPEDLAMHQKQILPNMDN
jgi:hypothetical protein